MKSVRITLAILLSLPSLALGAANLFPRHIAYVNTPPPFDEEWASTPHNGFGFPFLMVRLFESPTPEGRIVLWDACGIAANGSAITVIAVPAIVFLLKYRRFIRREGRL